MTIVNVVIWGIVASLLASLLTAVAASVALRSPTGSYPDLRGPWLITIHEGNQRLSEQANIKYQIRSRFAGTVVDGQMRSTRITGRCFGSQVVTYTHAHIKPSKLIAIGSGVVIVDILRRQANGFAVFVGPKAAEGEAPGSPTSAEVEMLRPDDWHS